MTFVNAPVHDLLIRIKNAYLARRYHVNNVGYSKFKVKVLDLLQRFKFIRKYDIKESDTGIKYIDIALLTTGSRSEDIPEIKFFSKPSRKWYIGWKEIKPVAGGIGIGIISTNQGLMASHEARKKKIGGELIAEIY